MDSYFYMIITLEVEVPKTGLDLGCLDKDGSIKKYSLEQLHKMFPSNLYDCTELLGSYVFSVKGNLKAKPFLDLRSKALSIMDVNFDLAEEFEERDLKAELKGSTVSEMVRLSQPRYYDFNLIYNNFRWIEYNARIGLRLSRNHSHRESTPFVGRGLQIYKSYDYFTTEDAGELTLLTDPLQSLLKDMPYSQLLSVRIKDVKR